MWVRLDDKRPLDPRVRAAGMAASGLDVTAICWSAHQEDDGFIADVDLEMLALMYGCPEWPDLARRLVEVGRWKRNARKKGYDVQGFLKYNMAKADIEARRERDRKRKRERLRGDVDSTRNPDGSDAES